MNRKLENFIFNEQVLNNYSLYEGTELENMFKINLPDKFKPESQNWFKLPYFLVPFSNEEKLYSVQDVDFIINNLLIINNGEQYYPFFVHPVTVDAYKGWIGDKYQFINEDESCFYCTPTSSIRTLLVKNENTENLFFVKVTLLDNVGGVFRKIDWESAFNQFQANEIVHNVLKNETTVVFFKDIAAMGIKNDIGFRVSNKYVTDFGSRAFYVFANVIRKIPDSLLNDDGKIICSFSSFTSLLRDKGSYLSESLKETKLSFNEYMDKYIFYPLKNYLLKQFINHGIIFEPHCQNLMLELNEKLIPTGNFLYRDFDSVSFDRLRFSINHKNLMYKYLNDAAYRTSLSANFGVRETLAISFLCHFMDDLINPCLMSATKSGLITQEISVDLIKKYYSDLKNTFVKIIPSCETKLEKIEICWNDDMSLFVDVDISEIQKNISKIQDFDKSKYFRVLLNEPYYHDTEFYAVDNAEIVLNTKNNKIFEVYLEK